ncbi:MAG: class I SAM-dependent methyltransferase [Xanthomonadales bacterium]|jgi:SAM-dependent methyltransferase|nr:class I SAM-dependent methyltransferase [Xanthomonadales bacterium]
MTATCAICNGRKFGPGPGGRMSFAGIAPRCLNCGSLERHRFLRQVWNAISQDSKKSKRVIQFSNDTSVEKSWFLDYELSIYGGKNSLDLQSIDRADSCYDIAICNHVLEHVEDDKRAFRELMRILNPSGFLQMTVPNPVRMSVTEDWGYPDTDRHGHFRHYGLDLISRFKSAEPTSYMFYVDSADPITGTNDFVFFWAKSERSLNKLKSDLDKNFEIFH